MDTKNHKYLLICIVCLFSIFTFSNISLAAAADVPVWQIKEIELEEANTYDNYYVDITCWIELTGPRVAASSETW